MTQIVDDEYGIRKIFPLIKRFKIIQDRMKTDDESIRWECVWLAGEMVELMPKHDKLVKAIADFMQWIIENDNNGVVRHEAAFQIGLRNFKSKIPVLHYVINNEKDDDELTKHESIEALALLRDQSSIDLLVKKSTPNSSRAVRETAIFTQKRLARLKGTEYRGEGII